MNLEQLKSAGFNDSEIQEYTKSQSNTLTEAGFSQQEIAQHLGTTPTVKPSVPEKEGIYEGFVKPTLKSIPRVAGAALGAAAAFPVSGVAGYAKHLTSGPEEAVKTIEGIQNVPMKLLKTPAQEKAINTLFKPFEWLKTASNFYGDKVLKHTGSGNLAAATATAFETGVLFGLPKLKGRLVKAVKVRNKVAIREAAREIQTERLRIAEDEPKRFAELAKKETELKDVGKPPETTTKPAKDTTASMLGTEHIYQEIAKTTPKIKEFGKSLVDAIDVEAPFKRVEAPDTGRAVKGMFSTRAMHEEFALDFAKETVSKVKFDKTKSADIALLAEQKNPKLSPEMQEPVTAVKKHFQDYQKEYKKYGVDIDFKKRVVSEIEEQITNTKDPKELKELHKSLHDAKQVEFVHIPSAMWFTDHLSKDPAGGRSILKLLVSQKRKNLSIQDLIKRKIIKKSDVNIVDILASYGRRAGKDLSLLEIVARAKTEGLAAKGKQAGFVDAPHSAPILKGHTLHPVLADLIFDMTRSGVAKGGAWSNLMSVTKMTQFYNPLFLPMYDIVQAGMIGTVNPFRPLKTLKYIKEGVGDAWNKTPEYWEAQSNYMSSKPFNNPLTSFKRMTENAKKSTVGMVGQRALESITPKGIVTAKALQNIYNTSWHLAWELDKTVRQISYRALKDKGYSPKEAAELAALAHSDYASVPAATRKTLNNVFFTPTFKITMGKFYANMIKNATKGIHNIPLDVVQQIYGKERVFKMTPTQKRLAGGLIATVAINQGWEFFMEAQGFKRDEWGRRYVKEVDTPDGKKEIVVTWSTPANMFLKYVSRAKAAFKPGTEKPIVRFFEMNKWELHPLYRVGYEIANNTTGKGDQVYKYLDSENTKIKKSATYAVKHLIALVGLMDKEDSDKEARELFIKESGQLLELATRPFTFKYMRSPEQTRTANKVKSILRLFKKQMWTDIRNDDVEESQYDNFLKMIEKVE